MLNLKEVKVAITDISFELELADSDTDFDQNNPYLVNDFYELITQTRAEAVEQNADLKEAVDRLKDLIDYHHSAQHNVTKDDLKAVYVMLKERQLHPKGWFDKQGRFYLNDSELVSVRDPSVKYPYTQMNAGRTSKFVKLMAEKYKPQSRNDLINLFRAA